MSSAEIIHSDCLEAMEQMEDNSVDTVITDPPAGISFMGKKWDSDKGGRDEWIAWLTSVLEECYRVMKPGGALLIWSIPRTSHWTGTAVENAGFRIIDVIQHVFGSGFPKSHNISKAIDRARNDDLYHVTAFISAARDAARMSNGDIDSVFGFRGMAGHWTSQKSQPAVPTWEQWLELKALLNFGDEMDAEVWRLNGRKGKPGDAWYEREVVGHSDNKIHLANLGDAGYKDEWDITAPATDAAQLWDGWGTALKPAAEFWWLAYKPRDGTFANNALEHGVAGLWIDGARVTTNGERVPFFETDGGRKITLTGKPQNVRQAGTTTQGRWPSNLVHDGSDEVVKLFPDTCSRGNVNNSVGTSGTGFVGGINKSGGEYTYDSGSAARFFYAAKASRAERTCGGEVDNRHPTVKPLALMRYLCRLTKTPTGGTVLDPFMGSGTTGVACVLEGRDFIGIDSNEDYCEIARRRIAAAQSEIYQMEMSL